MGATFSGRPSAAGPRYVFSPAVTGRSDVIARASRHFNADLVEAAEQGQLA
jgi:hypothetical protein